MKANLRLYILVLLFVSFLSACAIHPALPPQVAGTPTPVDRIHNGLTYPASKRPARMASYDLVDQAKESLVLRKNSRAIDQLHEAINIDPGNGVAYYYLAYAKAQGLPVEESEEIGDWLDRAETLLGGNKDWLKEIASFREELSSEQ